MRIKLLVQPTGTRNGAPWPPVGEEIELPDKEAARMCANRYAIPVATKDADVETRDAEPDTTDDAPAEEPRETDAKSDVLTTDDAPTEEPKRRGPGRPRKSEV